jgi:hypothetical protein
MRGAGSGLSEFSENQFGLERFEPDEADGAKAIAADTKGSAQRRRHPRYAAEGDAEVLLTDGSQILHGRILDIRLSGSFIETGARLRMALGTPVEMVFRANSVMLRTSATVRAIRTKIGAGFLFEGRSA